MAKLNSPPFPVFFVLPISFEERWPGLACQSCRGPGFDPNKAGIRVNWSNISISFLSGSNRNSVFLLSNLAIQE